MTVYTCENELEAMMTCVFEAWDSGKEHENVRLAVEPVGQQSLFDEYIHVDADSVKADRVLTALRRKISEEAYYNVIYASLSQDEGRLDAIYRFLITGFKYGSKTSNMLSEPSVMKLMEVSRKVGREAHYFKEFMRFGRMKMGEEANASVHAVGGTNSGSSQMSEASEKSLVNIEGYLSGQAIYVAHFEPKSRVVLLVAEHFADRMPSEYWIIVDDVRHEAAIHPKDEDVYLRILTDEEYAFLSQSENDSDSYTKLWCSFVDAIGIKQRENRTCRRNMFPIWMRKHACEFRE